MGINNFFDISRNVVQTSVYEQKKQVSSKAEERELEMKNLKPDKLPPYAGEKSTENKLKKQSVKLVLRSEEELKKFKRHFRVPNYIEPSVTNIELLMALLDELDSGRIQYDKKSGRITYHNN